VKLRTSKEKQMGPFDQVHKIRGGGEEYKNVVMELTRMKR
jgi:hypothetical protein